MKNLYVSSLLVFSLVASAALCGAQGQQESGRLSIEKSFQSAKAIKDSTTRFNPQIKDKPGPTRDMPENPVPAITLSPSIPVATAPHGTSGTSLRTQLMARFPGIGATGWVPPDPNIAVGPAHIVEVVNSSVAFFDKNTGQKTFQQVMDGSGGFFGSVGATNFVFDPKCYYDKISGRFIVLALELIDPGTSKLLIAVSDDTNPTGNWFKYRIEAALSVGANNYWMDYPSLGANKDGIVVCGNMFAMSGSSGFAGVEFVVMKKAPMLIGAATTVTVLRDPNAGSAQVAQMQDSTVDKIYGAAVTNTNAVRVYGITNIDTTPNVMFSQVSVPTFVPRTRPSNSTNGRFLDQIDSRLYNCSWKNGRLVAAHHTQVSNNDDRSICRWYSFTTNNWPTVNNPPTLEQSGNVSGAAGQDYHFPSINVNAFGDIAMTFCRSSTSITADVMTVARKASDPLGSMGAPVLMQSSPNPNYGGAGVNRWGDYYGTQVDPTDDNVMWGVGMTSEAGGNWGTHIVKFQVGSLEGSSNPFDALTCTMAYGSSFTGTVSRIWTVDGLTFNVVSKPQAGTGQIAGIETTYQIDQPASTVKSLAIKFVGRTSGVSTGMLWLWNWSTSQYEHVKSVPFKSNATLTVTIAASGDVKRFVNSSRQVKAIFRANTSPRDVKPITLNVDQHQLLISYQQN